MLADLAAADHLPGLPFLAGFLVRQWLIHPRFLVAEGVHRGEQGHRPLRPGRAVLRLPLPHGIGKVVCDSGPGL